MLTQVPAPEVRFEGVPGAFSQHGFVEHEGIRYSHPKINWKGQVEVHHDLLVCHGAQRTLGAIEHGPANGTHHAKAIAWVLGNK